MKMGVLLFRNTPVDFDEFVGSGDWLEIAIGLELEANLEDRRWIPRRDRRRPANSLQKAIPIRCLHHIDAPFTGLQCLGAKDLWEAYF
jgi:hypothetical protein